MPNIIIANLLFSIITYFLLIKNICNTGMPSGATIFSKTGYATEVLLSSLTGEQWQNPHFNSIKFDEIKNMAGSKSFSLTILF